ncbi:hypothetical protein UNDKW_0205 [Undibacterium sp. KW1]|uniref:hypothetical protein n=1 Tax=Undibacterium sp. KW1 TaxID=2058624 RepID=UPI001331FB51|nr:hypothetical protein [Undibacterium sp. KW1]BBB58478.1 hypothetical protein UNDKW_0205 [Undibacterium sp. KW1]
MGNLTIPTHDQPEPVPIARPSQPVMPHASKLKAHRPIPVPNRASLQAQKVDQRHQLEVNVRIARAKIDSTANIMELQTQLGIRDDSAESRINFYFKALEIQRKFSNFDIDNLYGLLAYELNALTDQDIYPHLENLLKLGIDRVKKMKTVAERLPVVGPNAKWTNVLTLILRYERDGANLRYARDNSFKADSPWLVHWNRAKFLVAKDSIIPPETQTRLFRHDNHSSYGGYPSADLKPQNIGTHEVRGLVWEELKHEGSCASINLWDSAIFTWGRGFAGLEGGLAGLLVRMYADPDYQHLFRAVGLQALSGSKDKPALMRIVTNNGTLSGRDASIWNYIKNDRALILFFIALGEMKVMPLQLAQNKEYYRQKVVDFQFSEICNRNPIFKVPDTQLTKWKQDFSYDPALDNATDKKAIEKNVAAKMNYERYIQFLAHLFHWLPIFGQDEVRDSKHEIVQASLNILKDKNNQYYKASFHNILLQFADRAGDDPINKSLTDADASPTNDQIKIIYHSLKNTRTVVDKNGDTDHTRKQLYFAPNILDNGHFEIFAKGLFNEFIVQGKANQSVIEFSAIELIDQTKPELGYQIRENKNNSIIKLNQLQFQGAALYFKFRAPQKKGDTYTVIKGYVIKAI